LKKAEEGKIIPTTSGKTGDVIIEGGRAYLTAYNCEELIGKLRALTK